MTKAKVTLDGNPAKISGCIDGFARVVSLSNQLQADFSWEAAKKIVERGGNFETW